MERLDREVKSFLKDGLENVKLSDEQKQNLRLTMAKELTKRQDSCWRRIMVIINRFMETTFEIRVAPVAAAICFAVTLVGAGIFFSDPAREGGHSPGRVVYMQQAVAGPDGSLQITYIPVRKEGL